METQGEMIALPSAAVQGGAKYTVHTTFNTGGANRNDEHMPFDEHEATHEHTPFSTGRRGTK